MRKVSICLFLLMMFAAFGLHAASLAINDAIEGGIRFTAGDFEGCFTVFPPPPPPPVGPNPAPPPPPPPPAITCGLGNSLNVLVSEGLPVAFRGTWVDLGQSVPVELQTVFFIEPGNPSFVSDILTYSVSTDGFLGHITGSFLSDSESGPQLPFPPPFGPPPGSIIVMENGLPFDFSQPFLSASVISDVENPVPEPGTILLVGGGFLSLRRLIRRKASA